MLRVHQLNLCLHPFWDFAQPPLGFRPSPLGILHPPPWNSRPPPPPSPCRFGANPLELHTHWRMHQNQQAFLRIITLQTTGLPKGERK